MRTGIDFFDRQDPKPGDLWIVASGPAMGKTTVVRNVAVGLGDNLDEGHIGYWDMEHTPATWKEKIERMGCDVPAALLYRNEGVYEGDEHLEEVLTRGAGMPTYKAVVIDHFGLMFRLREHQDDGLRRLKVWLVRTGKFGLVSVQLPREVWGKLKTEGEINPDSLPEPILDNGDAVFTCGKTPQRAVEGGVADTLRVIVCKSPTGLRDPDNRHAFVWDHQTGRLS